MKALAEEERQRAEAEAARLAAARESGLGKYQLPSWHCDLGPLSLITNLGTRLGFTCYKICKQLFILTLVFIMYCLITLLPRIRAQ